MSCSGTSTPLTIDNPVAHVLVQTETNLRHTLDLLDEECKVRTCNLKDESQIAFQKMNESIAFSTFAVSKCSTTTY